MARGLLETIQLLGTLVFAVPVALFGALQLLAGELLTGVGFLVLAGLMVLVREAIASPKDLPRVAVERVVGRAVESPEDDDERP